MLKKCTIATLAGIGGLATGSLAVLAFIVALTGAPPTEAVARLASPLPTVTIGLR